MKSEKQQPLANIVKKAVFGFLFFSLCTMFLVSCDSQRSSKPSHLRSSIGKTLELLVVADPTAYKGGLKEIVDTLFKQPQLALNQNEPLFDVSQIPSSAFMESDLFRIRRNVLIINLKEKAEGKCTILKNKWAYPQVVIEISAANNARFKEVLLQHFDEIKTALYTNERLNFYNILKINENRELTKKQKETFGFSLTIPKEFYSATMNKGFAWFRKEAAEYSIGILIYTQPYDSTLLPSHEQIIAIRNEMTKKHVPGSVKNSYMKIEEQEIPYFKNVLFSGFEAIETRGLWSVDGDHMGGPFINYVFVDKEKRQLVMLDGFVYNPNKAKRDLLMQAESVLCSIEYKN